MVRRAFFASGAVIAALGLLSLWWLTRRPFADEARPARVSSGLEVAREGSPPVDAPPVGAPPSAVEDAGVDLDLPLGPAPSVPVPVRTEPAQVQSLQETENYLLAGLDRTGGWAWGRADTILVASFDDRSGHVGVVSVPRDLHVNIPGHGPARINAALRVGSLTDQDPIALFREVVSDTLGMPIHHVVIVNLQIFEHTIDELGGVDVDVECPIQDNFIDPRSPGGRRLLDVPVGRVHMDGVTAAMYVRSRHGRSDLRRARRQQSVLLALRDRLRTLSPTEWIPVLADVLERDVTTTMSRLELILLARRIARTDPERIHGLLLGRHEVTPHRTPEGHAVLLPDYEAIDAALDALFEAPAPGALTARSTCPPADAALR